MESVLHWVLQYKYFGIFGLPTQIAIAADAGGRVFRQFRGHDLELCAGTYARHL
jgi:hypothetical protein